ELVEDLVVVGRRRVQLSDGCVVLGNGCLYLCRASVERLRDTIDLLPLLVQLPDGIVDGFVCLVVRCRIGPTSTVPSSILLALDLVPGSVTLLPPLLDLRSRRIDLFPPVPNCCECLVDLLRCLTQVNPLGVDLLRPLAQLGAAGSDLRLVFL